MLNLKRIRILQEPGKCRWFHLTFSLLIPLCLLVLTKPDLRSYNNIGLWCLSCIYIFVYLEFFLRDFCVRAIKAGRMRIIHLLVAALLAVLTILVSGLRLDSVLRHNQLSRLLVDNPTISLQNSGTHNPASGGDETALKGLTIDGKAYNLYELSLAKPWTFSKDGHPTLSKPSDVPLSITLPQNRTYYLTFATGPDAGRIRLTVGSCSAEYDLYCAKSGELEPNLEKLVSNISVKNSFSLGKQVLFYICAFALLMLIWLPIGVKAEHLFVNRNKIQEKNYF